jgi:hypothetical protein
MSKQRALLSLSLAVFLVGCESEMAPPPAARSTPPVTGASDAKPSPKPLLSTTAPVVDVATTPSKAQTPVTGASGAKPSPTPVVTPAPAPAPMATAEKWDAPVDGRPVFMKLRGEGVQIYTCKKTAAGYAWTFTGPEALLYNDKGRAVGKHGAGPSWELSDGSKVIAEPVGTDPEKHALPNLLLKTISTNGTGSLAKVKYIKRMDTDGGGMPTLPADEAHADKEERVPYRATYAFYAGS